MKIEIFNSKQELGQAAAEDAAHLIQQAIDERGAAFVVAATGASQFEFLDALTQNHKINWGKVTFFHLDEYVGLAESHPASFRRYLKERIVDRVRPRTFRFIAGDAPDVFEECRRISDLISRQKVDVAFVGIGENGHLAFNDPPADFETQEPYIVVELNEACRKQQVGEGWFRRIDEVPTRAVSMSIQQILKARNVLCVVPDRRKADAVRNCLELEVSPSRPASILQTHTAAIVYLDTESAALLAK
ncbi:MAG TPA: glucosamine-6-phosphate deaminase [Pyrinomonadaceae bacterium]|nr:glucosamine-6-phosphate deaminase [Pyrinomonadaceae bacterium]